MEWWTHALYALGILTVAFTGWLAWRAQRRRVAHLLCRSDRDEAYIKQIMADRSSARNDLFKQGREIRQLTEERDKAEARAQSAEQSNRAYKGHNKRYRERIAELETELDACYQDCAQLEVELEDAENEV